MKKRMYTSFTPTQLDDLLEFLTTKESLEMAIRIDQNCAQTKEEKIYERRMKALYLLRESKSVINTVKAGGWKELRFFVDDHNRYSMEVWR